MKKRKAFWLRWHITTRLTALAAVMLVLLCALWTWFVWDKAIQQVQTSAYHAAQLSQTNLRNLLQYFAYTPETMPVENTPAYWLLKARCALNHTANGPYILQYKVEDSIVSLHSCLPLHTTDGLHPNPTSVLVDISDFSEADIRSIQSAMWHTPPEWQGNSPYLTAYGMRITTAESGSQYFVPNRLISCVDAQVWATQTPVDETETVRIYFQDLFPDESAMNQYFEALHYIQMRQQNQLSPDVLPESWESLQTKNFFATVVVYADYTIYCSDVFDFYHSIARYFDVLPWQTVLVCLLLLVLFHWRVRRTVITPLYDTTQQAQHVAHLEFDAFHPDTARSDEIGDLNRALADMAGDLHRRWDSERDLEDRRQQFVAAASHDLKTPLALIGGYAEAIAQDISPEENARYLAAIEQETARMNSLVREMLDYTRLDRTDELEHRTAIDLSALTHSLLDQYAPLFKHRRLTADITSSVRIRGDETLLRRAFGCLLENAAKYSPDDGCIVVILRRSGGPLLTVENDCDPIPESELPRLFEMFYRGDKARSRAGGHGLGLAITQKILALHGLICHAENTETGVRFAVTTR